MDERLYRAFFEVERKHWWFLARQRIVMHLLQRRLKLSRDAVVIDVGCGTGAMLEGFQQHFQAWGLDISPLAVEFCQAQGIPNVYLGELSGFAGRERPPDLVTVLDVIEHVDDDVAMLRGIHQCLRPGGHVLVTVPAFQALWSRHDDLNHHRRRYRKRQLDERLRKAGFAVDWISYYNFWLFPLACAQRLAEPFIPSSSDSVLAMPPPWLNAVFTAVFASERWWLSRFSAPFGLSLMALGCKPLQ